MTTAHPPPFLSSSTRSSLDILARDWNGTSVGPPAQWPLAIQSVVATWMDSPQAMFVSWGTDLRCIFNDAYRPFLGERADTGIGRPFAELWADIWADIEPIVAKALRGEGSRFEDMPLTMTRNGYAEPTWWTFTYMPLRDENHRILGMLCTTSETTNQVLGARKAALERERQRHMLQQMPGFVGLLSGPDHVFDYVNDAYRAISGDREFIGRSVREVFPELADQGFYELLDRVYATGKPFVAQAMPIRLGDEPQPRFIDLLYQPMREDDGAVGGVFVGGYEVTSRVQAEVQLRQFNETLENRVEERTAELVRAQETLRQAQKLEAVGQLTGGVAHDFNNLLTVIGSSVELMRRKNVPEERRQKYLEAIGDTVRRAAKLTGQLLAFARRQPLRPEVFDVARRVEAVAELVQPLVGARVRIDFLPSAPTCLAEADVSQFETALVNLAVNARDAMNGEGLLTIRVDAVARLPGVRGQPTRDGNFIVVTMTDSGSGIAPDKLELIFEPFFTTKGVGKGTGLGLSQVFGFAKQSGGDVQVSSAPNEGATFSLFLPQAPAHLSPAEPDAADLEKAHIQGASILVVEDNATVGQFSTAVLHDLGYETTWATDAMQALALLAEDEMRFDLVFTDIIMPGMNGVELARTVRDKYPGLPVVLTSGYSDVLTDELPRDLELVNKPYSIDALSRVIRQTLRNSTSAR
ncbi:MAG: response regulator [Variovorax sp.]|nr:MAG: response regulator [Variovorax sp.]